MVRPESMTCPLCNGELKYYDKVKRICKSKYGRQNVIYLQRKKCVNCGAIHRLLPPDILPYKHYEAEMVFGVLQGLITPDVIGFEDYPSEITMERWKMESADILTYFDFTNSDF